MMKLSKYVLISAALLSGAACLTACSSDDTVSDVVNPNLSPDGKAVKTQFALNIPRAKNARMTGTDTQQDGTSFLGMEGIKLVPLAGGAYNGSGDARELISLPDIGNSDTDFQDRIKVYDDVLVPIGTKGFLFYGHATEGTDAAGMFSKGVLGVTNLEVNKSPGTYEFALKNVYTGTATSTESADAILKALNTVAAVEGWENDAEFGALYTAFTGLKAGSANSVLAAVQNLYDNVAGYSGESIGAKVKAAVENAFDVNEGKVAWKTANTFPTDLNLPEGCVALQYNNNKFSWASKTVIGGNTQVSVSSITYPASLYYTANTGVKANSSPTATFPTAAGNWETDAWIGWAAEVAATTRKIALDKTVNYAVAQLKTTFKCSAAQLPANDKVNADGTTVEQYVAVPSDGFTVTGLLVGGQPVKVNYAFQPAANDDFSRTVYDKSINTGVAAKAGDNNPTPNFTLLLSNQKVADEESTQNTVNFAVELKNNSGVAFQGADGIVPAGGTFYLIGKLDPSQKTVADVTNPSVFMPDYMTTANVTITTLANAYNCIPDLRSTNLELGLAVDLAWKTGMSFDVEIGQ